MVIASTVLWGYSGWDSTLESTFFGAAVYGYGLHWSTIQTFFLALWILAINLQVGGVKSIRQLASEMKKDLLSITVQAVIVASLIRRKTTYAKELWTELRGQYLSFASVDGVRGFFFSLTFGLVAILLFEMIWVPLYDIYNFGSLMWPVYYYGNPPFGNPFLSVIFLRNNVEMLLFLILGGTFLYLALDGEGKETHRRFSISWRLNGIALNLAAVAFGFWILWVAVPHTVVDPTKLFTSQQIQGLTGLNASQITHTHWIFPSQSGFPQTEYTFYNASSYLTSYPAKGVFGFWVDNPTVHLVNVLTKYATFAAVCYPAMIYTKRRQA